MAFESIMQESSYREISIGTLRNILDGQHDSIYYNSTTRTYLISKLIIEGYTDFQKVRELIIDYKVTFEKCFFKTDVFPLSKINFRNELAFMECYFVNELNIENIICDKIFFFANSYATNVTFKSGSFESIIFSPNQVDNVEISDVSFTKFHILTSSERVCLDSFKVINLNDKVGNIFMSNIDIKLLYLAGNNTSNKYEIDGVRANVVNFSNFKNQGEINCYNIQALSSTETTLFQILNSNLGKAEFYSTRFASFTFTTIVNSTISECLFSNCTWNETIRGIRLFNYKSIITESLPIQKTEYVNIKEAYRQLKLSMSKHNDKIQETDFYSKEMNVHNSLLEWNINNFWDKLILYFSRYTSNYGRSLGKPLFWLFSLHFFFFSLAVITGGFENIHYTLNYTPQGNRIAFEKFFLYLSPLRKYDDTLHGYYIIIDLFMRISASYLVYNMIRATRRFIG